MLHLLAIVRRATVDSTGQYRYWLERQWQTPAPILSVVMLNPSRADHSMDDPTLRRLMGLSQDWGFGALVVVNLFAYRTPHPRQLRQIREPVGPANDQALMAAAALGDRLLLAWGNGGSWHHRDRQVLALLQPYRQKWSVIGFTQRGQPRHPLYARRGVTLDPWSD
ncbi:MAG: DUF1643 domain-containing protein [Cyanobacteria bacterium REEB459]|nr:DUF1643 domain-containing protein [Cyanobacteria bacterium REEB459]